MIRFKDVGYLTDGEIDLIIERKVPAHLEKFKAPTYYFQIKKHLSPYEIGKIDIRIGYNENTFYGETLDMKYILRIVEIIMHKKRVSLLNVWLRHMG